MQSDFTNITSTGSFAVRSLVVMPNIDQRIIDWPVITNTDQSVITLNPISDHTDQPVTTLSDPWPVTPNT
jgi:hypothetical protein